MREEASVGLSDLGGAVTWGEAILLIEQYAKDPGTAFGAELSGWAYPATTVELLQLMAAIPGKEFKKVSPWGLVVPKGEKATADEVAQAAAELEDGIVFG